MQTINSCESHPDGLSVFYDNGIVVKSGARKQNWPSSFAAGGLSQDWGTLACRKYAILGRPDQIMGGLSFFDLSRLPTLFGIYPSAASALPLWQQPLVIELSLRCERYCMMHNLPSHPPPWLARIGASRYRLVLLTGSRDTRSVRKNVQRIVPGCVVLNLGLALSQRLLEVPSHQRPTQAPILLADLLAGNEPAMLYDVELLFDPTLQLEPLRALKAASRSRSLMVLWPGAHEDNKLTYAEPGHPEYKRYGPTDLADILVVPVAELTMKA